MATRATGAKDRKEATTGGAEVKPKDVRERVCVSLSAPGARGGVRQAADLLH